LSAVIKNSALNNDENPPQKYISRQYISPKIHSFIARYYPTISPIDRCDWKRQIKNTITSLQELKNFLEISEDERAMFMSNTTFNFRITPYYLSLLDPKDSLHSLRRSMIPTIQEMTHTRWEEDDPLHEDNTSPVEWLIHRYPDRVLFLVTNYCSARCRYCTRSRIIENDTHYAFTRQKRQKAIEYIAATPSIRDVLISWGDPLTLPDDQIDRLLSQVRAIPHVEMIRIGTKVPVVLPQRITPSLLAIFKKYHPLFISIHFTHPEELAIETKKACEDLVDAGIPLWSQTVLLKWINDTVEIMKSLMHGLLKIRIRPYYMYQCDPISGSSHFRTKVAKGLEIIQWLRGYTSWYAIPHYVIDAPWWWGKIPLLPEYFQWYKENWDVILKNYEGKNYIYPSIVE
jgi:lysine 2,3-aminomutase